MQNLLMQMTEEVPPYLKNQLSELLHLRMVLEETSRKRFQMEILLRDAEAALEELDKLEDNACVYKSVGEILIKTNKQKAKAELSEKKETFDLRLKTLERQEERMQKRFQQIQQQIREALGMAGFEQAPPTPPTGGA